jgi:hypothetical protein
VTVETRKRNAVPNLGSQKELKKRESSWGEIKKKLAEFDQAGLIGLVHDLYAAGKENQAFLHARFALGDDVLKPHKATIDRWLWPDVFRNQNVSVAKAKKAVSDYKKAIGDPDGLAELMVFYCEQASGFCQDVGLQDESHFNSLIRMFEQALKTINALPESYRPVLFARLDVVRGTSHDFGYGVGDELDELCSRYGIDGGAR